MTFQKFLIYWIIYVLTIITLTFVFVSGYFNLLCELVSTSFLIFISAIPIYFVSYFIAKKIEPKIKVAKKPELKREDDILLQAVGFSQSTLIILLNVIMEAGEEKTSLTILIAIIAIAFYSVRAWAKLKNNTKFRYHSMVILGFVIGFSISAIIAFLVELFVNDETIFFAVSSSLTMNLVTIIAIIFRKRYGLEGLLFPITIPD
jgi:hypothetical protein